MPLYRSHAIFEIARGVKAFLNLEVGVTRGRVPNPAPAETQSRKLKQAQERIAEKDRKVSELQEKLARLRAGAPVNTQARAVAGGNRVSDKSQKESSRAEPNEELVPPEELNHLGGAGEGYQAMGQRWFEILTTELGGLQPDERVLDVGCGVGRMAGPLSGYLSERGSYEGFDISPDGIAWCQENITSRYPHFRFRVADIYNARYNPEGKHKAYEYRFPYEDESFDFVFLASVFTHLLPREMENYFSEISRVLEKGGRCIISYFLLNEASIKRIEEGEVLPGLPRFNHDCGKYRLQSKQVPETAVAHDELAVRELYEKYGLNIVEPIRYGSWAGGENSLVGQDIVLAIRADI